MRHRIFISLLAAGLCAAIGTLRAQNCATGYCPKSVTFHHFIDGISPETVTITYPVVETDIGSSDGTNACWLAQNLGATTQASSATDDTDAAAGWYWQFNRKQGYAYNTSTNTRTPNTPWDASINESSDWLAVNDPCSLLLGSNWRLPTSTEWTNADANGSWSTYTTGYNSVLKLHAQGYLGNTNGYMTSRQIYGNYWSSTESDGTMGHDMHLNATGANPSIFSKTYGFSVRCIMDL